MKEWTKQAVLDAVKEHYGVTYFLIKEFPFDENDRAIIDDWAENEEEMTDSDVCDAILDLALNRCKK